MSFEKTFGLSIVFIESTLMENGGVPDSVNPSTLIKEAIHVISCGYEEKTEWGKEIGWIYGSVTEDILTGFKMHCRGWRSIYCVPLRPAFKGSAPINLSDRLHQVLGGHLDQLRYSLADTALSGTVSEVVVSNGCKDSHTLTPSFTRSLLFLS
ncbi:hypothetical protein Sjap_026155 [Stephania japonica]|uniref:Cellulose synthase n=1 Tax=Stephania japonica TaxID=461633 RepID=A0AAP0E341_9MAGN